MKVKLATAKIYGATMDQVTQQFRVGQTVGSHGKIISIVSVVGNTIQVVFEAVGNMVAIVYGIIADKFIGHQCSLIATKD